MSQVAELVDVRADYRANGTVALMTRSGVGLLDGKAGRFEFEPAGQLTAELALQQRSQQERGRHADADHAVGPQARPGGAQRRCRAASSPG